MPTNKDFKRLVRGRMQKTGESYTAARSHLVHQRHAPTPAPAAPDYAKLAGVSDESVRAKTGCAWAKWVWTLDRVGAAEMSHRDIARYVSEHFEISGWWAQTVTVGYERIRGLRDIGQRRGGSYEVSKSKTFAVPIARVYRAIRDARQRARWLDERPTIRAATTNKTVRMAWPDGTAVEAYFVAKGAAKAQVAVQHRKLKDRAAVARQKAFWTERLAALGEILNPGEAPRPRVARRRTTG
jgi:hypothetical protein